MGCQAAVAGSWDGKTFVVLHLAPEDQQQLGLPCLISPVSRCRRCDSYNLSLEHRRVKLLMSRLGWQQARFQLRHTARAIVWILVCGCRVTFVDCFLMLLEHGILIWGRWMGPGQRAATVPDL